MQYIIFGIIAVVGLVFLIVYNLRADAKQKKQQKEAAEPTSSLLPEHNVQEDAADDVREMVENAAQKGHSSSSVPDAVVSKKTNDHEYRHALRSFHNASEEPAEAPQTETKEAVPPMMKPDQQYRDALRSMKK